MIKKSFIFCLLVMSSAVFANDKPDFTSVFFNHAKRNIQKLKDLLNHEEAKQEKDHRRIKELYATIKTFTVANLVAEKNIEALKKMDSNDLTLEGQIWVEAKEFNDDMDGRLVSAIIGGQNAIAYVLFHASLNKTAQDNETSLAMIQLLLDKGLDPNAIAGMVLWLKKNPTDDLFFDYVSELQLVELAQEAFPQAVPLLTKSITREELSLDGQNGGQDDVRFCTGCPNCNKKN